MFYKRKFKSLKEFKAIIEMKTPKNTWKWNQICFRLATHRANHIDMYLFLYSKDNFISMCKCTLIRDRLQIFIPHWLQSSSPLISMAPHLA